MDGNIKYNINVVTLAEHAGISVSLLGIVVTLMLMLNALGITATVGLLGLDLGNLGQISIAIFILSAAIAVVLYFLVKRFLESICKCFLKNEIDLVKEKAEPARRLYVVFLVVILGNILLVLTAGTLLAWHLWA